MKIIADTHTHTFYSGDAFSTVLENISVAKEKGLSYICMTDHVNSVPRSAPSALLKKLFLIPREYNSVHLVRGVEVNIVGFNGELDVEDDILASLDWVIASLHTEVINPSTREAHTKCWQAIAENPLVDVIGHCGDPRFTFDIIPTVKCFHQYNKIVEINNHSFSSRKGAAPVCEEVAKACMQYDVPVVIGSDAHFAGCIGDFDDAIAMLKKIDFPEELILNADEARFAALLERKIPG